MMITATGFLCFAHFHSKVQIFTLIRKYANTNEMKTRKKGFLSLSYLVLMEDELASAFLFLSLSSQFN